MKNVCIAVRSVTYAQKGKAVLDNNGIPCKILRKNKETASGCGWCVSVAENKKNAAIKLFESNGVKTTGEAYDLS